MLTKWRLFNLDDGKWAQLMLTTDFVLNKTFCFLIQMICYAFGSFFLWSAQFTFQPFWCDQNKAVRAIWWRLSMNGADLEWFYFILLVDYFVILFQLFRKRVEHSRRRVNRLRFKQNGNQLLQVEGFGEIPTMSVIFLFYFGNRLSYQLTIKVKEIFNQKFNELRVCYDEDSFEFCLVRV